MIEHGSLPGFPEQNRMNGIVAGFMRAPAVFQSIRRIH